jgi:hypothetical protein
MRSVITVQPSTRRARTGDDFSEARFRLSGDAEHGFVLRLEGRDGVVAMDDVVIGTLQGVAGPTP